MLFIFVVSVSELDWQMTTRWSLPKQKALYFPLCFCALIELLTHQGARLWCLLQSRKEIGRFLIVSSA